MFLENGHPAYVGASLTPGKPERPRAITVDLGEAFWTWVLLLTKALGHVSSGLQGSSWTCLWLYSTHLVGAACLFCPPAHDRARGPGPSRTDPAQCPGRAGTWLPGEEVSLLPRFVFLRGPGAGFLVREIQGVAPGPAVGILSGYGYGLRSQVGVPHAFSGERRTEREVAGHLRDPASWA